MAFFYFQSKFYTCIALLKLSNFENLTRNVIYCVNSISIVLEFHGEYGMDVGRCKVYKYKTIPSKEKFEALLGQCEASPAVLLILANVGLF